MRQIFERIAIIGLIGVTLPLAAQDEQGRNDPQSTFSTETRTIAALPLEVLTNDPDGAALAAAAYTRALSALGSIDGVRVLGPDFMAPYVDSGLSPREIADQLEGTAVLEASTRAREPMFYLEMSLHYEGGSSGFNAPLGYSDPDQQITIYSSDGQPMPFDHEAMLEAQLASLVDRVRAVFYPESVDSPEQVAASDREIFLDTTLSLRERMDAFRKLMPGRWVGRAPSAKPESLDGEITAAAVDLAMTTDNAVVRETVWGELARTGDPSLVAPLLQSLASDPEEDVRLAAAKALRENFLEEPGVADALDYAMTSDPSQKVREEIDFSMRDAEGQTEALRATVLNTSLSHWERTRAFSQLLGDFTTLDEAHEVDAEVKAAMVELTLSTRTPRARTYALSALSRVHDPSLLDLYLTALARDSNEGVRETALRGLRRYMDEDGVREALEHAMVNDSSPLIRKLIEDTLRNERQRGSVASADTILDPFAAEQDKAAAWGAMRANASDHWTDSVVTEMVRIGTTSTDPTVRAGVWRSAHANHTHPLLLQPLLQALSSDPDGSVREEAAETLDLYLDQPGVRAALESAAQVDPDTDVREQAQASLAGARSGF